MRLSQTSFHAFVPMLEQYFQMAITVEPVSELIDFYRNVLGGKDYPKGSSQESICIGLENYSGEDYLLITEVKDVIEFSKILSPFHLGSDHFGYLNNVKENNPIILTTLQTHHKELEAIYEMAVPSVAVHLIKFDSGNCLPTILECSNPLLKYIKKTEIVVNPNENTNLEELIAARILVKYKTRCFEPSDDNYSNEYDEIYHLANIFGIPVVTAISAGELKVINMLYE